MTAEQIAEYEGRLVLINSILSAGVASTTVDGITTRWDFSSLRDERKYILRTLGRLKPVVQSIDLRSAY